MAARGERPLLCTKLSRCKEAALEESARVEAGVSQEGVGMVTRAEAVESLPLCASCLLKLLRG